MKLIIATVAFLFVSTCCFAQTSNAIYWQKDSLLTWNDFSGPIDTTSKFAAVTQSMLYYDLKLEVQPDGKSVVVCKTKCFFDKQKSWSIKGKQGIVLLAHEQLHFDIAEYFRRIFEKTVNDKQYAAVNRKEVAAIFKDMLARMNQMQIDYDAYTTHGADIKKQRAWCNYLADALDKNLPEEEFVAGLPK